MKHNRFADNKPPYFMGILCLIPLIGAFVGIALILYGIVKYKDKKLTFIGIGGVLITLFVYFFLFKEMKYGQSSSMAFESIAKNELNTIVKSIQFYNCVKYVMLMLMKMENH